MEVAEKLTRTLFGLHDVCSSVQPERLWEHCKAYGCGACNIWRCAWIASLTSPCINTTRFSVREWTQSIPFSSSRALLRGKTERKLSCFSIYDFSHVSKQNNCIQKYDVSGSCPKMKSSALTRGSGSAIVCYFLFLSVRQTFHCFFAVWHKHVMQMCMYFYLKRKIFEGN